MKDAWFWQWGIMSTWGLSVPWSLRWIDFDNGSRLVILAYRVNIAMTDGLSLIPVDTVFRCLTNRNNITMMDEFWKKKKKKKTMNRMGIYMFKWQHHRGHELLIFRPNFDQFMNQAKLSQFRLVETCFSRVIIDTITQAHLSLLVNIISIP